MRSVFPYTLKRKGESQAISDFAEESHLLGMENHHTSKVVIEVVFHLDKIFLGALKDNILS